MLHPAAGKSMLPCFNRTFMELKLYFNLRVKTEESLVLIVPLWN